MKAIEALPSFSCIPTPILSMNRLSVTWQGLCFSCIISKHPTHRASTYRKIGFEHVSESSKLVPMIKMVLRGVSSTADAYLTPILRQYLDGFFSGFDKQLREGTFNAGEGKFSGFKPASCGSFSFSTIIGVERGARVEFMASDGGLVDVNNFSGLKSILSGPAGGVVGYALTSWDERKGKRVPVIGWVSFRPCNSTGL